MISIGGRALGCKPVGTGNITSQGGLLSQSIPGLKY
jgi:hypothetical protein